MTMTGKGTLFLTDAQLGAEIQKCEYCEEKPCKEACPADCSPADFIMAVKVGEPSDYRRAAALIMGNNPLGGVCGAVCPDRHCMKACVHRTCDAAVNIPAVQATVVQRARELGLIDDDGRTALRTLVLDFPVRFAHRTDYKMLNWKDCHARNGDTFFVDG